MKAEVVERWIRVAGSHFSAAPTNPATPFGYSLAAAVFPNAAGRNLLPVETFAVRVERNVSGAERYFSGVERFVSRAERFVLVAVGHPNAAEGNGRVAGWYHEALQRFV